MLYKFSPMGFDCITNASCAPFNGNIIQFTLSD